MNCDFKLNCIPVASYRMYPQLLKDILSSSYYKRNTQKLEPAVLFLRKALASKKEPKKTQALDLAVTGTDESGYSKSDVRCTDSCFHDSCSIALHEVHTSQDSRMRKVATVQRSRSGRVIIPVNIFDPEEEVCQ